MLSSHRWRWSVPSIPNENGEVSIKLGQLILVSYYHTCFLDFIKVSPTIRTLIGSWKVETDSTLMHLTTYFHIKFSLPKKKKIGGEKEYNRSRRKWRKSTLKTQKSSCCLVAKSCLTLQPHGLQPARPPLSMRFSQARILEWVAISFSTEVMYLSVLIYQLDYFNFYTESLYKSLWTPVSRLPDEEWYNFMGIHVHKVLKSYILKVALLSWLKQILSLNYMCMNSINTLKLFEDSIQHS